MKRKEQYADEIIEMLERTKCGAWASNINLNTKDRVIEVCQNCVDSWSGRKFKDHCTTPPQALEQTRWIPVSERLPNNHEYIKNNGLFNVSDGNRSYSEYFDIYDTERFGEPTMNEFRVDRCVVAWMPLPEPYEPQESEE